MKKEVKIELKKYMNLSPEELQRNVNILFKGQLSMAKQAMFTTLINNFMKDDNIFTMNNSSYEYLISVISKLEKSGCIIQMSWAGIFTCSIFKSLGKFKSSINVVEGTNGGDSISTAIFKAIGEYLLILNKY